MKTISRTLETSAAAFVRDTPDDKRVIVSFILGWSLVCVRLLIAGILTGAALGKIQEPTSSSSLLPFDRIPRYWAEALARVLPFMELLAAALLMWTTRVGAVVATTLFVVFIAVGGIALLRGRPIDCGCFGGESSPLRWGTLFRNSVLCVLSASVAVASPQKLESAALGTLSESSLPALLCIGFLLQSYALF